MKETVLPSWLPTASQKWVFPPDLLARWSQRWAYRAAVGWLWILFHREMWTKKQQQALISSDTVGTNVINCNIDPWPIFDGDESGGSKLGKTVSICFVDISELFDTMWWGRQVPPMQSYWMGSVLLNLDLHTYKAFPCCSPDTPIYTTWLLLLLSMWPFTHHSLLLWERTKMTPFLLKFLQASGL